MSDVFNIWVSLLLIARRAEGGDWSGHMALVMTRDH